MDKAISDTTMMFLACACYALHKRNGFGKNRLIQFIADINQVNEGNNYDDLRKNLIDVGIDLPEVNSNE